MIQHQSEACLSTLSPSESSSIPFPTVLHLYANAANEILDSFLKVALSVLAGSEVPIVVLVI